MGNKLPKCGGNKKILPNDCRCGKARCFAGAACFQGRCASQEMLRADSEVETDLGSLDDTLGQAESILMLFMLASLCGYLGYYFGKSSKVSSTSKVYFKKDMENKIELPQYRSMEQE